MLSTKDRIQTVQLYYRHAGDIRRIRRDWVVPNDHQAAPPPSGKTVRAIVKKFAESGSILDRSRSVHRRVLTAGNIDTVRTSIEREPMLSTRRRARQLGISRSSLLRILHGELGARAYKLQVAQLLKPNDLIDRLTYSRGILQLLTRFPHLHRSLIMSDEAHFNLSGEVFNRQNVRFWGTVNPRIVRIKDPHAVRVTVWCGLSAHRIIGPYFFHDERGTTVSVTGDRYRRMLQEYVFPLLTDTPVLRDVDWWWQQDAATAHTARETMHLLQGYFGEHRIISQRIGRQRRRVLAEPPPAAAGDMLQWPSRSPDLSAPDFFLWGYLKECVYDVTHDTATTPTTLAALRDIITREIERLNQQPTVLNSVMLEVFRRARECIREEGRHLRGVLFKTT